MNPEKIVVGCDHGGYILKKALVADLKKKGLVVKDMGTFSEKSVDYPDTAYRVASFVSRHESWRGLLICKSGIGNAIVANKLRGVRAALCYTIKAASLSRRHNDANVLVLGSLFVSEARAKRMIDVWLKTPFEGGRHSRRIGKIERIERLCGRP